MFTVTPKAAEYIKKLLDKAGIRYPPGGMRFGVKAGGCKGLKCFHEIIEENAYEDKIMMLHGARVIVDPHSIKHLQNTQIDHTDNLVDPPFIYNNRDAKSNCSCGKSFQPEEDPGK